MRDENESRVVGWCVMCASVCVCDHHLKRMATEWMLRSVCTCLVRLSCGYFIAHNSFYNFFSLNFPSLIWGRRRNLISPDIFHSFLQGDLRVKCERKKESESFFAGEKKGSIYFNVIDIKITYSHPHETMTLPTTIFNLSRTFFCHSSF